MTIKKISTLAASLICAATAFAASTTTPPDTAARMHRLRPLEVLGVKQNPGGGIAREAITKISGAEARILGVDAMKNISLIAPNFFMPDYGSRMTSSIYVRGLGARIDQPVVGMTVDNIPFLNKDNYDFDIADIESIEVLRGAQSVLNGRNTMGGQIYIRTFSPMRTKGLRAMLEYGSGNTMAASVGYYGKLSPTVGMSINGQYRHSDGFFDNEYNGDDLGVENSGAVRWKTVWQPSPRLSLTNTATVNINRQDGYPYASVATGKIEYNDTCRYDRNAFADGITLAWAGKRVVVTSVTSVQYLDDTMILDQDFKPVDYFTLTQARKEWTYTEDLFTRGSRGAYSWLGGVFAFHKSIAMDAPVTFKDTGISQLIEKHPNDMNPDYPISWDSRQFTLGSNFDMSTSGFAVYHESDYALGNWRFEAGFRLDMERNSLSYNSRTSTGYTTYHLLPDGTKEYYSHTPVNVDDYGDIDLSFTEFLPKATISYETDTFTPYVTFSKGYKAGGFNTQMFSDVLQQRIMSIMGMTSLYKLEDIVSYDPEYSFNYEAGFHANLYPDRPLALDLALFYIDCRNQQLTVFPAGTTTGRIMTNAGRTRSFGAEISATWNITPDLILRADYGYTNATFRRYNDGRADYRGKRVPYAPSNTLFGQLSYRATPLEFCGITPTVIASARCVGSIYWDEANSVRQPFYCIPGIDISFTSENWSLKLWAKNLTDTQHDVFHFKSIGNSFVQHGKPRHFGATLRVAIR